MLGKCPLEWKDLNFGVQVPIWKARFPFNDPGPHLGTKVPFLGSEGPGYSKVHLELLELVKRTLLVKFFIAMCCKSNLVTEMKWKAKGLHNQIKMVVLVHSVSAHKIMLHKCPRPRAYISTVNQCRYEFCFCMYLCLWAPMYNVEQAHKILCNCMHRSWDLWCESTAVAFQ